MSNLFTKFFKLFEIKDSQSVSKSVKNVKNQIKESYMDREYHPNGQLKSEKFFDKNGVLKTEHYYKQNDDIYTNYGRPLKDGEWKEYAGGTLFFVRVYKNNSMIEHLGYSPKGQLKMKGIFKDDVMEKYTYYYENGQIKSEEFFEAYLADWGGIESRRKTKRCWDKAGNEVNCDEQ
jgi:antitoxin component YwqK of YwqJK toxin-antitoxin module